MILRVFQNGREIASFYGVTGWSMNASVGDQGRYLRAQSTQTPQEIGISLGEDTTVISEKPTRED